MYGRKIVIVALLFLAGASVAIACGPYFPWQLLDDRTTTLKSTPKNSFAFEAAHLAFPPADHLKPVELAPGQSDEDRTEALVTAEWQGLSDAQTDHLKQMQTAGDADAAYAIGDGLPSAVRLYAAGAVAFHKTDIASALARFEAVLALPTPQRSSRAVWAAYMAGRTAALAGDAAKASAMFAQTRRLAIAGQPDPLGLAVASFGEEARLHYDHANGELVQGLASTSAPPPSDPSSVAQAVPLDPNFVGYVLPAQNASRYRDEMAAATELYAEQAARGSDSGVQSLRIIAQNVLSSPDRIDAVASAPMVQRLLVVYALARIDDSPAHDQGTNDAGTSEAGVTLNPALPSLVAAIEKFGGANPAGADRLAALCYRIGRYDLAARLVAQSASPLAEWVKAKIALQKGDLASAAQHYAAASKGFPQAGASLSLDADNANLVVGETGVVALARGEYVDALDKLYPVSASYWGDVANIAERVLTVDELKTFVDAKARTPLAKTVPSSSSFGMNPSDPASQLRNLLARRLMREGRYGEAYSYFDDPAIRAKAVAYAAALHEANTDWGRVDRAQAFFAASRIARESGMEILGYEAAPDFGALAGNYDTGIGQDDPKGPFVTVGERSRAAASNAQPNLRYHYRYVAVEEATQAADLLPPRSQAFATVLCSATGWMLETQDSGNRARMLYRRYVKQGAHVAWAKKFGRDCPAPNFDSAIALERHQLYTAWRHYASVHRWWIAGAGLLLLFGVAAGFVAINRRRKSS